MLFSGLPDTVTGISRWPGWLSGQRPLQMWQGWEWAGSAAEQFAEDIQMLKFDEIKPSKQIWMRAEVIPPGFESHYYHNGALMFMQFNETCFWSRMIDRLINSEEDKSLRGPQGEGKHAIIYGLGKSYSLLYGLRTLLYKGKTVFFVSRSGETFAFIPKTYGYPRPYSVFKAPTDMETLRRLSPVQNDPSTFVLVDSLSSKSVDHLSSSVSAHFIIASDSVSSPHIQTQLFAQEYFLPAWSLEDILFMRSHSLSRVSNGIFSDITEHELRSRFDKVGANLWALQLPSKAFRKQQARIHQLASQVEPHQLNLLFRSHLVPPTNCNLAELWVVDKLDKYSYDAEQPSYGPISEMLIRAAVLNHADALSSGDIPRSVRHDRVTAIVFLRYVLGLFESGRISEYPIHRYLPGVDPSTAPKLTQLRSGCELIASLNDEDICAASISSGASPSALTLAYPISQLSPSIAFRRGTTISLLGRSVVVAVSNELTGQCSHIRSLIEIAAKSNCLITTVIWVVPDSEDARALCSKPATRAPHAMDEMVIRVPFTYRVPPMPQAPKTG